MATAIAAIVSLIIRFINMWINKYTSDVELKKKWLEFMDKYQERAHMSATLRKSYMKQVEHLRKSIDEQHNKK